MGFCRNDIVQTYIPCWSPVVGLRSVVPAFAMAAQEKHFIFHVLECFLVESLNLVVEALPLRQGLWVSELLIGWVGAIDEPEIDFRLRVQVRKRGDSDR